MLIERSGGGESRISSESASRIAARANQARLVGSGQGTAVMSARGLAVSRAVAGRLGQDAGDGRPFAGLAFDFQLAIVHLKDRP